MEVISVSKIQDFDPKTLWGKEVKESDCKKLVKNDTLVLIGGEPQILYKKLDFDFKDLIWACQNIKYSTLLRSSNRKIKSTSATFGYMPRRPLFSDYCHESAIPKGNAAAKVVLDDYAKKLEIIYSEYFPSVFEAHKKISNEKISQDWRLEGSIFSSGIVNKDNQLPYHKDAGNFKGVFSNMIGLKNDVGGGHLICPEIDLKFEISHGSLLIFNGQEILHGVSPIVKKSSEAYRFTVVYYTLEQMWKCLPLSEEVARIRQIKTKREIKRNDEIRGRELSKIP